jgi:hypothetical protein
MLNAESYSDVYPVENVLDKRLPKLWRGTEDDEQRIVIDFGSAIEIQAIAILGHNFDQHTVRVEANDTDSWVAPAVSYTPADFKKIIWTLYDGTNYRYWSIFIDSTYTDTIPEIGYLYLGNLFNLPIDMSRDFSKKKTDNSSSIQSDQGSQYTYDGVRLRQLNVKFPYIQEDYAELLDAMFDAVHKQPFITIFDITDSHSSFDPIYGFVNTDVDFQYNQQRQYWTIAFGLQEAN